MALKDELNSTKNDLREATRESKLTREECAQLSADMNRVQLQHKRALREIPQSDPQSPLLRIELEDTRQQLRVLQQQFDQNSAGSNAKSSDALLDLESRLKQSRTCLADAEAEVSELKNALVQEKKHVAKICETLVQEQQTSSTLSTDLAGRQRDLEELRKHCASSHVTRSSVKHTDDAYIQVMSVASRDVFRQILIVVLDPHTGVRCFQKQTLCC